jgi:hypothetical protein
LFVQNELAEVFEVFALFDRLLWLMESASVHAWHGLVECESDCKFELVFLVINNKAVIFGDECVTRFFFVEAEVGDTVLCRVVVN